MLRGYALIAAALLMAACSTQLVSRDTDTMQNATVVVHDAEWGHGSGVLLDASTILTAAHVAESAQALVVEFLDGTRVGATIAWSDAELDAAMLRLDRPVAVQPVTLDCSPLVLFAELRALGNPQSGRWVWSSVTVASERVWEGAGRNTIVVQGPLIPGMSGGPVFNDRGSVAGIVAGFFGQRVDFHFSPSGMSFIVPASAICEEMEARA